MNLRYRLRVKCTEIVGGMLVRLSKMRGEFPVKVGTILIRGLSIAVRWIDGMPRAEDERR